VERYTAQSTASRAVTHLSECVIMCNVSVDVVCHTLESGIPGASEPGLDRLVLGVNLDGGELLSNGLLEPAGWRCYNNTARGVSTDQQDISQ